MTASLRMASPDVEMDRRSDGTTVLRSREPLADGPDSIFVWLERWAAERPHTSFVTEPVPGGDRRALTYAETFDQVERAAGFLASRGIRVGDRVVIAAANSLDHLVLGLAVMRRGAIYVPMAPQYVGPGHDREKLVGLLETLDPALVVCEAASLAAVPARWESADLAGLSRQASTAYVATAVERPDPDGTAKILLTSGSTGIPKPVPYSHRLMAVATSMTLQVWSFVGDRPPVVVDWLPWNHAFGGTANLHLVVASGGTLHIDAGGPGPQGLDVTLRGVAELRPDLFFAVPATLDLLRAKLEADAELSRSFFSSVRMIFTAGAALSSGTFRALVALSEDAGHRVVILSGWGGTETGPGATLVHVPDGGPGWIGTPLPGVEIKLTPEGDKLHASVRGPNVFPGYWGQSAQTSRPFDDEGFYRTGDAAVLVDVARPELGLRFDGRLGDDFKLANGTWVDYSRVRAQLMDVLRGHVIDLVVGVPDGPALVALAWTTSGAALPQDVVSQALEEYGRRVSRPSDRVVNVHALATPPTAIEVSPKGQLRPAQVREARHEEFLAALEEGSVR